MEALRVCAPREAFLLLKAVSFVNSTPLSILTLSLVAEDGGCNRKPWVLNDPINLIGPCQVLR